MKKFNAIAIAMAVIAAMTTGCAAPAAPGSSTAPSSVKESPKTDESITIGIAMPEIKNVVFNVMAKSAEKEITDLGYKVILLDANNDPQKQASQIEDLLTQGVSGILFTPVDSAALSDTVKKVNEKGIPIVAMDRSVESGSLVALIESDNIKHAYEAGVAIVESAKAMGISTADLKVLNIQGDLASSAGRERDEGIKQAAKDLDFTIVSSLSANWDPDKAYNATLDGFQADPNINAIFMATDSLYLQPVESVLKQQNKLFDVGEKGHVITAGVDGSPYAMDSIRARTSDISASQQVLKMGTDGVHMLVQAIKGEVSIDANVVNRVPPIIVTAENVDSKELWANNVEE